MILIQIYHNRLRRFLIVRREEARRDRDFALADSLRDEIAAFGITVRDSVLAKDLPKRKSE